MKRTGIARRARINPGSGLTRSSRIARKARIKASNPARQRDDFARVYHSEARRKFVASLPCSACGIGPCQGHHIENDGAGRKAHYTKIIPLCVPCHEKWHHQGRETFQRKWHMNAASEARRTERRWQDHLNRNAA